MAKHCGHVGRSGTTFLVLALELVSGHLYVGPVLAPLDFDDEPVSALLTSELVSACLTAESVLLFVLLGLFQLV